MGCNIFVCVKAQAAGPIDLIMWGGTISLMIRLWLQKDSIGLFARECLQGAMGKDVLYDTINRKDLNFDDGRSISAKRYRIAQQISFASKLWRVAR